MTRLGYSFIALLFLCIGILSYFYFRPQPPSPNITSPTNIQLPPELLKISSYDERFQGLIPDKIHIAYFGFTQCPDVCPSSLAILAAALNALPTKQQDNLQALFISLDPERDNPKLSAQYAHYFHPNIVGLSPHPGQLLALSQSLGVYYRYIDTPNSALGYTVDHNSFFYFIDDKGQLLARVPHTLNPQDIIDKVITLTAR